jgi:hypothetical protein
VVLFALVGLVAGGAALAATGLTLVRHSTAGRQVEPLAGPDDPGYQAYVVPTPTMAVVERAADGELGGVALLALESNADGGSVILIPPSTLTRAGAGGVTEDAATSGAPAAAGTTLADVYRDGGSGGVVAALADLLALSIPEQLEVDATRWASLVAPVAPVVVEIGAAVGQWEAGEVELDPDDIGPFLSARAEGETDLDRIERQERFWAAWLPLVAEAGDDALPGEIEVGIGRFVRGLASGSPTIVALPVTTSGGSGGEPEVHRFSGGPGWELMARAVPFPESPSPDRRMRVRLLNGSTDPGLTAIAAQRLVEGGAEITIAGNALSFDEADTRLLYGAPEHRPEAIWLAAHLGDAPVAQDPSLTEAGGGGDDEIDVTVILGRDARDLIGR